MKHVLLQLPLGVQPQNENQLEQMANILEEVHEKYVPTLPSEGSVTPPDGSSRMYDTQLFTNYYLEVISSLLPGQGERSNYGHCMQSHCTA